jgi:hypothetical protein
MLVLTPTMFGSLLAGVAIWLMLVRGESRRFYHIGSRSCVGSAPDENCFTVLRTRETGVLWCRLRGQNGNSDQREKLL